MWLSNKLWRVSAVPEAFHVSSECGGLTLSAQPVPWNAEAVIVEVGLLLPPTHRRLEDYALRLPGREPVRPEALRPDASGERHLLFFRFPPPLASTVVDLTWRDTIKGRAEIKVLSKQSFIESLRLFSQTIFARVGGAAVAAQAVISAQCSGWTTSGMLTAPTSLAPLVELGLTVEVRGNADVPPINIPVTLSGGQLVARQALVAADLRLRPKNAGPWTITWRIGDTVLATLRARTIGSHAARRSLRVVGTRFIVVQGKSTSIHRHAPGPGEADRVGPCFLVASSEPGLAARFPLEVMATGTTLPSWTTEALITDGPTPIAPGTLSTAELADVTGFELRLRGRPLATLPLHPAPAAKLTSEGGFVPPLDFAWSAAADEELAERLSKLTGL